MKMNVINDILISYVKLINDQKNIDVVMSKRQLNIAKEAEKRYLGRPLHQYYSAEDLAKAFRDGAEWTDKNHTMRRQNHCVKINYPEQNKITMRVDFSNKEGGEE